jgi:hypothetical protein
MEHRMKTALCLGMALTAAALAVPQTASARQVCGWYAIAFCATSRSAAENFANDGWGQVIKTSQYRGFRPGYFCVVSGPQSKSSAQRDVRMARRDGVSATAYAKRACTHESNIGD